MCRIFDNNRGLSLIELVVTMVILGLLGSMILPSARMTSTRVKEIELKRNLREIRTAIDDYKKLYDQGILEGKIPKVINKAQGYPKSLEVLVEGDNLDGYLSYKKKFLRRIPPDPFLPANSTTPWGLRSSSDEWDSQSWGGDDVFDVYSQSDRSPINGKDKETYKDW